MNNAQMRARKATWVRGAMAATIALTWAGGSFILPSLAADSDGAASVSNTSVALYNAAGQQLDVAYQFDTPISETGGFNSFFARKVAAQVSADGTLLKVADSVLKKVTSDELSAFIAANGHVDSIKSLENTLHGYQGGACYLQAQGPEGQAIDSYYSTAAIDSLAADQWNVVPTISDQNHRKLRFYCGNVPGEDGVATGMLFDVVKDAKSGKLVLYKMSEGQGYNAFYSKIGPHSEYAICIEPGVPVNGESGYQVGPENYRPHANLTDLTPTALERAKAAMSLYPKYEDMWGSKAAFEALQAVVWGVEMGMVPTAVGNTQLSAEQLQAFFLDAQAVYEQGLDEVSEADLNGLRLEFQGAQVNNGQVTYNFKVAGAENVPGLQLSAEAFGQPVTLNGDSFSVTTPVATCADLSDKSVKVEGTALMPGDVLVKGSEQAHHTIGGGKAKLAGQTEITCPVVESQPEEPAPAETATPAETTPAAPVAGVTEEPKTEELKVVEVTTPATTPAAPVAGVTEEPKVEEGKTEELKVVEVTTPATTPAAPVADVTEEPKTEEPKVEEGETEEPKVVEVTTPATTSAATPATTPAAPVAGVTTAPVANNLAPIVAAAPVSNAPVAPVTVPSAQPALPSAPVLGVSQAPAVAPTLPALVAAPVAPSVTRPAPALAHTGANSELMGMAILLVVSGLGVLSVIRPRVNSSARHSARHAK